MSDQWKCGNEFLPYHRSASHVNPDHRDGWNACFAVARSRIEADEALMRQAADVMEQVARDFDGCYADHELKPVRAAITALRTRLEKTP
jgi:truncated hemoglobin YjbI